MAPLNSWFVLLKGLHIDTVFFVKSMTADEVRKSLIEHDFMDDAITVELERIRYV